MMQNVESEPTKWSVCECQHVGPTMASFEKGIPFEAGGHYALGRYKRQFPAAPGP